MMTKRKMGLIVDYGNVYKQLEKAYSIYGEGSKTGGKGKPDGKPVAPLEDLEVELKQAIKDVKNYLKELDFSLQDLKEAKPMAKIAKIKNATDCVCLNETTRTTFEMMARNVFRKYKALFPSEVLKPHVGNFNAIEAIYTALNQNVKAADVTQIIMDLQAIVSDSVAIRDEVKEKDEDVYVDLSSLDFDKLRAAFAKTPRKNTLVFNLQEAIEQRLEQMMKENPLRIDFYERYKEIIDEYNKGKSLEDTIRTFENLNAFIQDLSFEEQRVVRENLGDQETLAIFDLLKEGKDLTPKEIKEVKKVAAKTLETLKAEKLKIEKWRESRQIKAQVKSMIYDSLLYLPEESYSDEEVGVKTANVYQHIFTNYYGAGNSVYGRVG